MTTKDKIIEELKKEIDFKENRISDLLVERDTGKWRQSQKQKFIEEIEKCKVISYPLNQNLIKKEEILKVIGEKNNDRTKSN